MQSSRHSAQRSARTRQNGYALIIGLLLAMTVLGVLFVGNVGPLALAIHNEKVTAAALAQARDALIGRAAADDNRPGSLPCPDAVTNIAGNVPNDGIADFLAGPNCPTYVGRLPWRTLGLPDLRDGAGERLWYALSGTLRDDNSAEPVNSDSAGNLSVTGTSPANNIGAIVFSPGAILSGQDRSNAGAGNIANYLEGENANGDVVFATAPATATFNDRLVTVSMDAIFQVVEIRIAREIINRLDAYYSAYGYYPYASIYGDPNLACVHGLRQGRLSGVRPNAGVFSFNITVTCPTLADWPTPFPNWFYANNWHMLSHYAFAQGCTESTLNCSGTGFLTVNNAPAPNNKRAVVIIAGRALAGQTRTAFASAVMYVEGENANANDIFETQSASATFNDRTFIVAP